MKRIAFFNLSVSWVQAPDGTWVILVLNRKGQGKVVLVDADDEIFVPGE